VAAYGVAGVMRFAFNRDRLLNKFLKAQRARFGRPAPTAAKRLSMREGRLEDADETAFGDEPGSRASFGSNMWAFAPSRTQSGHAILMGNPHQPWEPVSTYYEAHLTVPGKLDFYGSTFIGRPILTGGWNEFLGWSHTVNSPFLEQIYELDLDPQQADHYLFEGGSVPLERDDVTIRVKSEGKPTAESRTFWHTPLGPVVDRRVGKVYVLRSACYDNYRAYEQWLRMMQAKSYDEFRKTVEMNQIPMFNICYSDRAGNIFYLWNGTVPILPHPDKKTEAVHAARWSDVWTRFHVTADLPQLFNPPGGYVQNCNSPPYLTNLFAPLDPKNYPSYFSPDDLSLRTQHSLRLVHNDRKFSLEEVCELKHSPLMLLAERVKADLVAALRAEPATPELEEAIRTLKAWDNTVSADSRGGTLFANWWDRYAARNPETGTQVGQFAVPWRRAEPMTTPRGLSDGKRAVAKFHEALREVNESYARPDVAWGDVHRIRKGKSVDLSVSGGDGLMGCFRVVDFRKDRDGKLAAWRGDGWVFAVEFSQPPKAYTVVAYSQSDVPGSPHFSDQAALFSAGKMKRAAFTDAEIEAQHPKTYRPGEE
jgi:acyl-homoserine-lactone acylase